MLLSLSYWEGLLLLPVQVTQEDVKRNALKRGTSVCIEGLPLTLSTRLIGCHGQYPAIFFLQFNGTMFHFAECIITLDNKADEDG